MDNERICPQCGSADVMFSRKNNYYLCEDCEFKFKPEKEFVPLRIFISYGHDEFAVLAEKTEKRPRKAGASGLVWFDIDRLKPGGDWERYIEEGLEWAAREPETGRIILLMTPHSTRRPDGYCLNEIARAPFPQAEYHPGDGGMV